MDNEHKKIRFLDDEDVEKVSGGVKRHKSKQDFFDVRRKRGKKRLIRRYFPPSKDVLKDIPKNLELGYNYICNKCGRLICSEDGCDCEKNQ